MPHIQVIDIESAESPLKEIYDEVILRRGALSNVLTIQSLNPESIRRHMDLYLTVMFGQSPLKRYQREMIAVVVSAANQCDYCEVHHGAALNHFWKDKAKVMALRKEFRTAGLDAADLALCEYAYHLTKTPWDDRKGKQLIESVKSHGFTDRAVLDASLVVSYFNFVNRMVLGLGVNLDDNKGEGYHYD